MPADLVLLNGTVYTSDPRRPFARAVSVAEGLICGVGTEAEALVLVGPATRVVDLRGRMVCAGFQDAHVHPVSGGRSITRCDVTGAGDASAALELVRHHVADHPSPSWVLGRGWAYSWFPGGNPAAEILDGVTGDRPAYLVGADGHSGWANAAALRRAGLEATTRDPPDGRIERLPDGRPSGTLHEGAMGLLESVIPADPPEEIERALLEGQRILLSSGVTAWQDAWVTDEVHRAYLAVDGGGALRGRVRGALWWDRREGIEQIDRLVAARAESTARYQASTVKLMLDGVCENLTAAMSDPYLGPDGGPGGGTGLDLIDPEQLPEIVSALDAAGFQCHFHAIGDAAVRNALDAVERARGVNGWSDNRHHIAHIQVVDPADIPRFHRLGVVANAQPLWACNDAAMTVLTVPVLGHRRSGWQYPFGSLHRSGAVLAMGSDWPVSSPEVVEELSVAVRRLPPGEDAEVFLGDERLPLSAALAAFTTGSAYVNGFGDDSGMVATGMRGDLVVLSHDLFTIPDPHQAAVDMTVVGGEVVYER